jgi:pimeloyl-ACP methyl ester carboxylesterase
MQLWIKAAGRLLMLLPLFSLLLSCSDPLKDELGISAQTNIQTNGPLDHGSLAVQDQYVEEEKTVTCSWQYFAGLHPNETYRVSIPDGLWNGDLIVYAHGYVSTFGVNLSGTVDPFGFPEDVYQAEQIALGLGYAFAASSFSTLGLSVLNGLEETIMLRHWFASEYEAGMYAPDKVYLVGGSQGGIIATLTAERMQDAFDGVLSLCGPCGNFQKQLNHYGDFRLLFEYFFGNVPELEGLSLGTFKHPNPALQDMSLWIEGGMVYSALEQIIEHYPDKVHKLISVSKAVSDTEHLLTTMISLLWYHIFTIEDSENKLGGFAYDNTDTWYYGTGRFFEDWILNRKIQRISGDPVAMQAVRDHYETTGYLKVPLVMMHTTGDPIQSFWLQQPIYRLKVISTGKWPLFSAIPINRYGHCAFEPQEMLLGFVALVLKVEGRELLASL